MRLRSCHHEREVTELLRNGHWPLACTAELSAHISRCSRCSELVLVTQIFQQDRIESEREARLESSGAIWWRAQLRGRSAALESISRPIRGAEIFALFVNLVAGAGILVSLARHGFRWRPWLSDLLLTQPFHMNALWSVATIPVSNFMALTMGFAAVILLSGVVVYFALDRR
jgi:hypothetical protein